MNIIYVDRWRRPDKTLAADAFRRLNQFVRGRIVPPPIGVITFTFKTGQFSICGKQSRIVSDRCEVLVEDGEVSILGDISDAAVMVADIEAEIVGIDPVVHPSVTPADLVTIIAK